MATSASARAEPGAARPSHWLVAAALRAGVAGAGSLSLPRGASTAAAWEAVARALGLTNAELASRIAPALGIALADFDAAESRALRLIPERVARRLGVFPLAEDDRIIVVATANPTDLDAEQAIGFAAGRRVVFRLAPPLTIAEAIDGAYAPDHSVAHLVSSVGDEFADAVRVVEEEAPEVVAADEVRATPVVKLTNLILRDAVTSGASDAHIEPGPRGGVVRFRIDGVMRVHMRLPNAAISRVVSRVKVVSKLDIADRLRPQDGRARIEVDGATCDLRVSTVPTRDAEKAVIRILRPDAARGLDDCGLTAPDLAKIRQLMAWRDGIVVVTGPTGSGKTTTMYSAIREIATGDINVMTVEDPVEYELPGVTQIQVEPRRDVTFASALRAILRQDPDVIFVGEIRDAETAHIAAQAALTGHLVFATLHTNDAMGALARLADLGLDRATIAGCLRGVVAQRLVRRVCRECAVPVGDTPTDDERRLGAAYGVAPAVRAVGCPACAATGFRGRLPVTEVALVTPALAERIADGASAMALHHDAVAAGMRTLTACGAARAAAGETTLREVERVLGDPGAASGASADPGAAAAPPRRVLIVDDDPVLRDLAGATLRAAGFDIEAAEDGDAVLRALGAGRAWDLVVTDLHMPRVGGAVLLDALRHAPETANVPVIVLTGSEQQDDEIALMDAGADDYLRKPIDPPRLVARVRAALRRRAL